MLSPSIPLSFRFFAYVIIMRQDGTTDGGWYDETPPRVLGASPADRGVNVKAKKVNIYFDEFVKIDNPTENVIVSPPQLEAPEIKGEGKKIVVELKDSLKKIPHTRWISLMPYPTTTRTTVGQLHLQFFHWWRDRHHGSFGQCIGSSRPRTSEGNTCRPLQQSPIPYSARHLYCVWHAQTVADISSSKVWRQANTGSMRCRMPTGL